MSKEFIFDYDKKGGDIFVLLSCDKCYLFKGKIYVYWYLVIPYVLKRREKLIIFYFD